MNKSENSRVLCGISSVNARLYPKNGGICSIFIPVFVLIPIFPGILYRLYTVSIHFISCHAPTQLSMYIKYKGPELEKS